MSNTRHVYLAGPIVGCTLSEASDWRTYVIDRLAKHGIVGISPLRCEPPPGGRFDHGDGDPKHGTSKAIGTKNFMDVRKCDVTFAHIPAQPAGWDEPWAVGTLIEVGAAHIIGKPVIVVSNDPTIRKHPVVNYCAGWVLEDMDSGIEVVIGLLSAYS
jgi:nucleoside 2-deoxyribosyltransferase